MAGNIFNKLNIFAKPKREASFDSYVNSYNNSYNPGFSSPRKSQAGRLKLMKPTPNQLIGLGVVVLIVIGFSLWFKNASDKLGSSVAGANTSTEKIAPPYATKQLDREFSFPLRNEKGDKVSELKYIVQNAELTKEIVVKGQKANAVVGRSFLILNLKINNDSKQKIQVQSRDYVRLIVNNNDAELLAPDIHNDPVEVQPISTKFTRLGFAINESDQNLKLQIGEIDGEKQMVDIVFD